MHAAMDSRGGMTVSPRSWLRIVLTGPRALRFCVAPRDEKN